jgi:hypothetical protein
VIEKSVTVFVNSLITEINHIARRPGFLYHSLLDPTIRFLNSVSRDMFQNAMANIVSYSLIVSVIKNNFNIAYGI